MLLFRPITLSWFGKASGTLTWKWFKNLCAATVGLMEKLCMTVYVLRWDMTVYAHTLSTC